MYRDGSMHTMPCYKCKRTPKFITDIGSLLQSTDYIMQIRPSDMRLHRVKRCTAAVRQHANVQSELN